MIQDVVVIGAGIFGSVITKALRSIGRRVLVIDGGYNDSGSIPAACLMKHSWFTSLGKTIYDPALETLNKLYRVLEVSFKVGKLIDTRVFWIPPIDILCLEREQASVKRIRKESDCWLLHCQSNLCQSNLHYPIRAKTLIVAAGIWTELLVPEVEQKGLAGVAFLWPENQLDQPFVQPWAPYKQIVGFNRGDGLWVGDGTSILWKNWNKAYELKSLDRCSKAVGLTTAPSRLFGIRPYHVEKPCLLKEVKPGLWVATGGAKNGTLAAGWCAHELMSALS